MTWTSAFGRGCGVILQAIVNGLALTRISPNVLTFIGLVINTGAAIFFGFANSPNYVRFFLYAGLGIIGAGIFDMVDRVVGAVFASVLDRYSDVVLFLGLLVFYARGNRFFYVVLTAFVMITSLMVSYTRARSEALIGSCKVGFMERPERVVLIILGALFERWDAMAPALWVLAVLSTITVIHRISYTYTMAKGLALDERASASRALANEARSMPIRPAASPGPVSGTASVSGAEQHELLSAPNAPRA